MEVDALKRIRTVTHCLPKEVETIQLGDAQFRDHAFELYVEQKGNNPNSYILEGYIEGPLGSPWERHILGLTIDMSPSVPLVHFKYPIYHPNVYPDKKLCTGELNTTWRKYEAYNGTLYYRNLE